MRIVVFLLALLGCLACAGVGLIMESILSSAEIKAFGTFARALAEAGAGEAHARVQLVRYFVYALLAAVPLGMLGGMLALIRRRRWAAPLLLLTGAAPLVILALLPPLEADMLGVLAGGPAALALGGLASFLIRPLPRRDEEEEEEEQSAQRPAPRKPASPAITAVPPPPAPAATVYPCPGCGLKLKLAPQQKHRAIRCSKCGTTFPIPAHVVPVPPASPPPPLPPAEEEVQEEVAEGPKPRRRKRRRRQQDSPVAIILAFLVFVGGGAVFSVLAATDVIHLDLGQGRRADNRPVRTRDPFDFVPPAIEPFGEREPKTFPPDPAPDAKELARLAAERQTRLAKLQTSEKQLLDRLRAAPPTEGAGLALCRLKGEWIFLGHVVFAPDSRTVAAADHTFIRLWDVGTAKERLKLTGHTKEVTGLAFSPDGRLLASVSRDKSLRLWNVATGAPVFGFTLNDASFTCVTFSPDGKLVLGGTDPERGKAKIKAWEVDTGRFSGDKIELELEARALLYSPDGRYLLAKSAFSGVTLYSARTFERRRVIKCDAPDEGVAFSPDGQALAAASHGGERASIQLSNPHTGAVLRTFPETAANIDYLSFSPDGKFLASKVRKGEKDSFTLWDMTSGKQVPTFTGPPGDWLRGLAFSPGGIFLAVAIGDHVDLWAVADLLDLRDRPAVEAAQKFAKVSRQGTGYRVEPLREFKDDDLAQLKGLPKLVGLRLAFQANVSDAGLAHLAGMSTLRELDLRRCNQVTDAGLAHLKDLRELRVLNLSDLDKVTDAGLARLAGLAKLRELRLSGTKVTAAGMTHLKGMTGMEVLDLSGLKLGAAGLVPLKGMTGLMELNVSGCGLTDAGLEPLSGLVKMRRLWLPYNDEVTDAGMAHLASMKRLTELNLEGVEITSAGMAPLQGMTELRQLNLTATRVTDAGFAHLAGLTKLAELSFNAVPGFTGPGLAHLKAMKGLKKLNLTGTGVKDAGLAHLAGLTQLESLALPAATTDAGFIHLAGLTNLKELDLGEMPGLKGPGLAYLKPLGKLTTLSLMRTGLTDDGMRGLEGLTQLESLSLPDRITDAGFVYLAGLTKLKSLWWGEMPGLKGPGLAHLKRLSGLTYLSLTSTGLTDDGMRYLEGLSQLRELYLPKQIGDVGVAHLKGLTGLKTLSLEGTKLTDAGVVHLKGLTKLSTLSLKETKITDAALAQLPAMTDFSSLYLNGTKVSKEAVEKLKKARPNLFISQ